MKAPRSAIIGQLYERYYRAATAADDMSSHWRDFSSKFEVEVDEHGDVVSLTGFGFGELHWRSRSRRILQNTTIQLQLLQLPQRRALRRLWPLLERTCRSLGVDPTLDAFRQLCTLELLERSFAPFGENPRILLIGDGFGVLAALLKGRWPRASIVLLDLGQSLLFQAYYLQQAFPDARHQLSNEKGSDQADFTYCPSDSKSALTARTFDAAVNVASMQEMDPETVADYFTLLRSTLSAQNLFYCCNRESKRLPDGTLSIFQQYPWMPTDRILLDEPCPWHQYYLTPRSTGRPLRVWGLPIPGTSLYDGTHRHRLCAMTTTT